MRWVCGDVIVGRSIPLQRVLLRGIHLGTRNWFYDHEYRAKLYTRLASIGNPEACFYDGMCVIFVKGRTALMPWLDMLECSTVAGHDVATFVLFVLHRSNSGASNDNIAWRWLRKVEGDEGGPAVNVTWKNEICTRCLQHAMFML